MLKRSFDVAVMYEAIYYLLGSDTFFEGCRRVLRKLGTLTMCSVNKSWSDFNPSPFSTAYYSAPELFALFTEHGFQTEPFGAFHTITDSSTSKMISLIKRTTVSLHLIPGSMKSNQWLKRIFYGKLAGLPAELGRETISKPQGGQTGSEALMPISSKTSTGQFKLIYAVGCLP